MNARAAAAEATGRRILDATITLYTERDHDHIALTDVADRAGVTVQTVLRRYGDKDRLIAAAAELARERVLEQRNRAPEGDTAAAVDNLLEHYETWGDRVLRLLAQEDRVPALRAVTNAGRAVHRAWTQRVFAAHLARRDGDARTRLEAQLIAACDVYTWKILRRDLGLNRAQTALALTETIDALTGGQS